MSDFDFVINKLPGYLLTQCPTVLHFTGEAVRGVVKIPHNERHKMTTNMIVYSFPTLETLLAGLNGTIIDPLHLKQMPHIMKPLYYFHYACIKTPKVKTPSIPSS